MVIAVEDMVVVMVVAQLLMVVVVVVAMAPKEDMVKINQFIFLHDEFLLL